MRATTNRNKVGIENGERDRGRRSNPLSDELAGEDSVIRRCWSHDLWEVEDGLCGSPEVGGGRVSQDSSKE